MGWGLVGTLKDWGWEKLGSTGNTRATLTKTGRKSVPLLPAGSWPEREPGNVVHRVLVPAAQGREGKGWVWS